MAGSIHSQWLSGHRPLNVAHRGASAAAPENTLAAFRAALELGADGVELDVQLSRDGEVVVCHNTTVDQTTDGHGPLRDMTLAELRTLDAGSWFGPEFAGERIPTLQEVFDLIGNRALLNVEMKTVGLRSDGLEARVAEVIATNSLHRQVIVSSGNPLALWRLRCIDPRILLGLLHAPYLPLFLRRAWLRPLVRPEALHPHYTMVDAGYMRWAQGCSVNVWTVDGPAEMRRLIGLGVKAIITNHPDVLAEMLGKGRAL